MLSVDPRARLSVRQVLEHPWLRDVEARHAAALPKLSSSVAAAAAAGLDGVAWPGPAPPEGGGAAPPRRLSAQSDDEDLNDAIAGDDEEDLNDGEDDEFGGGGGGGGGGFNDDDDMNMMGTAPPVRAEDTPRNPIRRLPRLLPPPLRGCRCRHGLLLPRCLSAPLCCSQTRTLPLSASLMLALC